MTQIKNMSDHYDRLSARDAHLRVDLLEIKIAGMSTNMKKSADNTTMIKWLMVGGLTVFSAEKFGLIKMIEVALGIL